MDICELFTNFSINVLQFKISTSWLQQFPRKVRSVSMHSSKYEPNTNEN